MWEEKLKIYDKLIAITPDVERKGKTVPYTSANGYMFSQLNKQGEIGIRLPKEARAKFMEAYENKPFMSYGAVMREYVLVPEKLLDELELLSTYLTEGYRYVCSLEPKPTKKK